MFPGRYGRRNVVNLLTCVSRCPSLPVVLVGWVGLLVQILVSGRGRGATCLLVVCGGVGDKPSAY